MRVNKAILGACLLLFSIVLINGCDQSFDPIKESTSVPLSIYGYLDASADTQFVRITPIRYQLDQSLDLPEMHVTLQRENSDETILFNDSLFQFRQGFNVINTWTTEDIKPDQTYRLRAERADGASSRVSITIPKDFPQPQLLDTGDGCTALIRIKGVERIVDVQSRWDVDVRFLGSFGSVVEEKNYSLPLREQVRRVAAGEYEIFIDTYEEVEKIRNQILVPEGLRIEIKTHSRDIFVASGGPEWRDEISSIGDLEYALPEGLSNIENGLGYMVGIVSKTIPYFPSNNCFE
jgi:hypothetical protein